MGVGFGWPPIVRLGIEVISVKVAGFRDCLVLDSTQIEWAGSSWMILDLACGTETYLSGSPIETGQYCPHFHDEIHGRVATASGWA